MRPMFASVATDVVGNVRTFNAGEVPHGLLDGDTSPPARGLERWRIENGDRGEIMVMAPDCDPGALTLSPKDRSLASRLLYSLARDLLDLKKDPQAS